MEIPETVYEGIVENSYNKILQNMLTVLYTAGQLGDYPPHKKHTQIMLVALESERKGMYIVREIDKY